MFTKSNVMIWLSKREEKKVLDLCKSHLDKMVQTVMGMKQAFDSFCDKNPNLIGENYKKTFDSEREADDIKHKILRDVSIGPLHPIDREEVIRLVLTADDIAENAKSAAGKIQYASTGCLTPEIEASIREMADLSVKIVETVRAALEKLGGDTNSVIDMAEQVEVIEEKIDNLRLALVQNILSCKQQVISIKSIGPWLMLLNAIENMEMVADRSEDVADVIRSIAIMG